MPFSRSAFFCLFSLSVPSFLPAQTVNVPAQVFGYRDFSRQAKIDRDFLATPDSKLAAKELKTLTAAPHVAGSKEDYATAIYVAKKFRTAGLKTKIVEYTAWMNLPREVFIEATAANGSMLMTGPAREHVDNDPYQDDPRVLPAFNGSSPSGDVTAGVVYANYGRPEDFNELDRMRINIRGKLVLVRYGANFRGVKVYLAQQRGAAGVILYSDPADDGYYQGDQYPHGPWRPATGIQRGSVQFLFKYPGDATAPGIASTLDLPTNQRIPPAKAGNLPTIPSIPLSYRDASPILEHLGGPVVPRGWQGALPFSYHVGGADAVKVHLRLEMDYAQRPIWDVIGTLPGVEFPAEWVITGNHRDAWVYGAVDPGSGTVALLQTVRGIKTLQKQGWKPKRTMVFCSWDGEEEGLIGSTEWSEAHTRQLEGAVAYFNTDVAVAGPRFEASAVPSLKQFVREVTMEVPSPRGGSLYEEWRKQQAISAARTHTGNVFNDTQKFSGIGKDVRVGDLGSGSDFTPFLQHLGVPSTDVGSVGPYGVYHSVFDNYAWFMMNADPTFVYEEEMTRVLGLEALHMADADVLPYDYVTYGKQIEAYLAAAQARAKSAGLGSVDFSAAAKAAQRLTQAAAAVYARQLAPQGDLRALDQSLRQVEKDLLSPAGLPGRSWFKHTIYAPGEYTGYAAVAIPGVNEAIGAHDTVRTETQMGVLTAALNRAAATLESAK